MSKAINAGRLFPRFPLHSLVRHASTKPQTDKSRILEKPARFNPPSHPARRVKPRLYPGPKLTVEEEKTQRTKRYPNMMPPEGSLMHYLLTSRWLHAWITLTVLLTLAIYSIALSFINTTAFRHELPTSADFFSHPWQTLKQLGSVYKLHMAHESELVAEKRRRRIEDAEKRKEFLRVHGVDPGFLTGSWMEKFGTVENDQAREALRTRAEKEQRQEEAGSDGQSPVAQLPTEETRKRPKRKLWLGIW